MIAEVRTLRSGRPPTAGRDVFGGAVAAIDELRREMDRRGCLAALGLSCAARLVTMQTALAGATAEARAARDLGAYLAATAFGLNAYRQEQLGLFGMRNQAIARSIERVTSKRERDAAFDALVEDLLTRIEAFA